MLQPGEKPYQEPLADGLTLRTAASVEDVERVAAFNGQVHGTTVDITLTRNVFLHHPYTSGRDLFFVTNAGGEIVSTLCLIPWKWSYAGVEIPVGELGLVGTREDHRHHGLIRTQVERFKRRLLEGGYLLSQIQGIRYYYRQFGYEYALPFFGGVWLDKRLIPEAPATTFTFRQARIDDIPALMRLYEEAARDLTVSTVREESVWHYLLTYTATTETESETLVMVDTNSQVVGYMRLPKYLYTPDFPVNEASSFDYEGALAALRHLKTIADARGLPGFRLDLPDNNTLVRLARSLLAHDLGRFAWQIHIPDVAALLRKLAPALEARLAASVFAGLTRDLRLGMYRETILLRFVAGKITEVTNLGFTGDEEISVPPLLFTQLLLGYRSLEELHATNLDIRVAPAQCLLVGTLFPKTDSFIYWEY